MVEFDKSTEREKPTLTGTVTGLLLIAAAVWSLRSDEIAPKLMLPSLPTGRGKSTPMPHVRSLQFSVRIGAKDAVGFLVMASKFDRVGVVLEIRSPVDSKSEPGTHAYLNSTDCSSGGVVLVLMGEVSNFQAMIPSNSLELGTKESSLVTLAIA